MVKIRLKRFGSKKKPVYRIVVIDSRSRRDGRPIEEIGFYDPRKNPAEVRIDTEAYAKWMKNGAHPTEVVERIAKNYTPAEAEAPQEAQV
jgi:small subunit ribosomal protein S16